MTQVPQKPLVPNNTLMTKTPEEGRALALMLARNSIHAIQGELETLKAGRANMPMILLGYCRKPCCGS